MKIVISRKGFDSGYGKVASPILPDGRMISLPIPAARAIKRYGDLLFDGRPLSDITSALTGGAVRGSHLAHLDPDLTASSLPRLPGWRPAFGQEKAAQSHLVRNSIGPGDLFLFFGWFRQTEWHEGKLRYARSAPNIHAMFGYLQVDTMLKVDADIEQYKQSHPWLADHPHLNWHAAEGNAIYIGRDHLNLDGVSLPIPGAGAFNQYRDELRLTAEGRSRSVWSLPAWFSPDAGTTMTYHGDKERWQGSGDHTLLSVVAKGQEFVVEASDQSFAINWVRSLIGSERL